jgi:hypothetical protein
MLSQVLTYSDHHLLVKQTWIKFGREYSFILDARAPDWDLRGGDRVFVAIVKNRGKRDYRCCQQECSGTLERDEGGLGTER